MSKAYAKTRTKKNTQTATTSKQQAEQQYQQNLIRAYNTAADLHRQDVRELAQQTRGLASKMDTFDSRGTYLRNRQSVNEYQRDLDNYKAKLRQLGSYGYNTTSAIQNAGRNSYTQSVLDSIGSKYTEPKRNILDRIAGAIDRHAAMAGDPFGNGTMAPAANSTRNALERSRDTRFQNAVSAELTRRRLEQTATPKINGTRSTGSKWLDNLMNATAKVGTYDDSDASMMMGIQAEGNAASRNRFENIMRGIGSGWKAGNLGALAAVTGKRDLNTSDADMMFRAGSIGDTSGYELPGIARVKAKISKWANEQADLLDQESQDSIALAKDGLGTFGSMLVDAGIAGGQMGLDFGLSALTGGAVNSLGTMGVRVFGQANREAKRNGATDDQAFDYALGNAAVEVLTEKISNVAAPFAAAYGAGTIDDFIKQGIKNAAKTKAGRLALTTLSSAVLEGSEELIAGFMNPLLEAATYGGADALRQFQSPEFWTNLAHDFAVGALMGGFGMAGNAVSVASEQMRQNAADRSLGRTITEAEYTQRLMEANVIQQNQRAGEIAAQLQKAKSGSRRADLLTGRLYNAVNEGETQTAMANRLVTLGVDAETAPTIASGIQNELNGMGATRAEIAAMQQYERQTNRVRTEYEDALEGSEESSNQWARELGSQQFGRAMDISFAAAERAQRAEEGTTEEAAPKAETLAVNEQEGVQNNGQSVLPGGSQRYDGQSAGGEVRQLEEGAGRDQSREAWGRPADREIAQSAAPAQQKTVSSRQIHPAGIDSDNLYQPEVKTKAMKRAEKWAKQHGKKAVFFAGDMLTVQHTMPDGNVENVRVRGMIDGDTIYLRADDAQFTSEQIAKHETTHDLLDTGRISRDAVKAALQARYTPEEIDNICNMYASAFAGMTDTEAWDEIICDSIGGMNIFRESDAQGKGAIFRDILDSVYEEANRDYEARKGQSETRAEEREDEQIVRPKAKFSMETAIEETKDLVAVHNLTYDNLRRALKLGGIPMPSIAIIKAKNGFNQYGPMSFVFQKDTIDPKKNRKNRIYGSDAWTPTAANARVEYPIDTGKSLKLERKIDDLAKKVAGGIFSNTSVIRQRGIDDDTTMTAEELAERMSEDSSVRAAYLASKGENIEPVMREVEYDGRGNEYLQMVIDQFGLKRLETFAHDMEQGEWISEADSAKMREIEYQYQYDRLKPFAKTRGEDATKSQARKFTDKKTDSQLMNFLYHAWEMHNGADKKTEVDKLATDDAVKQKAPQKDVIAWLLPQIEELYGEPGIYNGKDPYTASGSRKTFSQLHWDYTLENIVKAMISTAPQRGAGLWGVTPTGLQSVASTEYGSLAEVKADSGRLNRLSEEEYKQRISEVEAEIAEAIEAFLKDNPAYGGVNSFGGVDSAGAALIDIASKMPEDYGDVAIAADSEGDHVSEETAKKIYNVIQHAADLPTDYFEAKPQRAIGFEEIAAAIMPSDAPADLKSALEERGVPVREYEPENDEDRTKQLNAVEGVKFSREATNLREANREIEKLLTMADYWRGQTQRTTRENAGPNERDVLDVAKALIKDYGSSEDPQSIRADIRELARYIMRGEPKTHDVRFETVSDMAYRIAQKVVEPTMEVEPFEGMGEQIRKDLRDANIDMTTVKGDFAEGWREIMQITRGKIKNKKGGAGIDTFWMEMQERYGTGVFPEDITNPADQLRYMAELYDQTQTQEIRKPESAYYEEVMWCRNDIIDKVLGEEIRQAPPTKMDKALEKADASKRAAVSRERERLARQAEKFAKEKKDYADKARKVKNEALERQERKLKEHFREVQKNQRERRSKTALWRRILAKKNDFLQLKAKPGQAASRHAPAELANALAAVADCFNIENRKRTVNAKGLTKSLADLSKVYEAMKGDERNGVYYDEGLADFLKQTATAFGSFEADALTLDELERMDKLLRSFHHTITHANQFMTRQWSIGLIEAGRKWTREVMEAAPVLKGLAGDLLNFQLRPDSFFARLSGFAKNSVGEQVQKMFADSTERMLTVQRAFYQNFREYSEDKRFDKLTARGKKDLVDVGLKDVDGNKVLLTRDMMLAVYKHLSSQDNLEAAAYGGLEIPDLDKYYTGKVAAAFDAHRKTAHADANLYEIQQQLRDQQELARNAETEADRTAAEEAAEQLEEQIRQVREEALQTMLDVRAKTSKMLTDYEKKLVEASESWMDQSAAYINEVTMNMYGFEKANVPKYWPMHRDTNFVQTDMRNAVDEINLENWGSLKERVKSHAPIKLTGFIFELDNHTVKMSRYYGFAEAQRDFNKLYNTQLPSARSSLAEQVQKKFGSSNRKLGVSGQQYIDAYLASISGANEVNTSFFSPIRRNLPRATLTINLRVAVSQLASIPTAAGEIGWGAMLKGMPRGFKTAFSTKAKNELAEKNVWFWQRYRGEGGMREFADMKEEQNWFDRGWNKLAGTKVGKVLFNWCQDFDVFATASMWAMSEEYVKSNTDLKPGTEEFDQRVGEVYRDVIRKTQPNYTETERSDLLRDKREGMKFLTMYKTQSNQNLNIVYEASARFAQYKRDLKNGKNGVTKADVDQAGKQLARAYTAVLLGGTLAFSILRAAANAILHNMNAYRDDDDEVTLEGILNGILDETIGAFAGMFAFGSEIEPAVMAIIKKEKYWGLTISDVSALTDLLDRIVTTIQKATDADKDLSRDDVEKLVKTWAQILGVPYDNGKKIYEGVWGHIEDIQNGEFLSFESGVKRTGKTEAKKLVDAMLDGDKEKAEKAWEHLLETKADKKDPEGTAQNAVKDHLKDLYFDDGISEKQMKKLLKTLGWDDDAKIDEFVTGAKCKKETGYYPGKLKEGYLDGAFGDKKAVQYLKEYSGKDQEEAEETLNYWKMNKKYGFDYNDTGDMYAKGKISEKEAKTILMTYGDYSEEDADDKVLKWGVNKEYGFDYDDTREQYVKGNISGEEAAEIWSKYGGMDDEKIADRLLTADFLAEHPEVDEENVTANRVELYDLIGKGANIPADKFMEYAKKVKTFHGEVDAKGKSIPYSTQDKIIAWINTLDLSPAQKTAVFATYFDEGKIPTNSYKRIKW